jgi:hypothetical protein
MAPQRTKRKRKKPTLPKSQVTALIVLTVVLLSAVIWFLMGGFGGDGTPFDKRLLEIAKERGIPRDAIVGDDPIRKAGKIFVRTWRFSFPDSTVRDGFLGDVEIEGAARKGQMVYPDELAAGTVRLLVILDDEGEAFDLHLTVVEMPADVDQPDEPTPVPSPTPAETAAGAGCPRAARDPPR